MLVAEAVEGEGWLEVPRVIGRGQLADGKPTNEQMVGFEGWLEADWAPANPGVQPRAKRVGCNDALAGALIGRL